MPTCCCRLPPAPLRRLTCRPLRTASLLPPQVADFGLSKQKVQTYVTGVNSQRGTLPWTAPEIIRTPDAVTEKIDVFRSVAGVVLQLGA